MDNILPKKYSELDWQDFYEFYVHLYLLHKIKFKSSKFLLIEAKLVWKKPNADEVSGLN